MSGNKILFFFLLTFARVWSLQYVESELQQVPKLFHLDDYESCLDDQNGIYCMAQFQIYSDVENHTTFELIQKYSQDPYLYNRTYLHRGYCLTTRCAGADANLTARFERCVDKWARHRHGLRARMLRLDYCKENGKRLISTDTRDASHRIFLYVVLSLLLLNVIGTLYDLNAENTKNLKGNWLRMWSLRESWNTLTQPPRPGADNRLNALDGIKFIMTIGPIYCHVGILVAAVYQKNPRFMEKFLLSPAGPMIGGLTTASQANIVISIFLTSYSILMVPSMTWKSIPLLVLKRLIRMLPVYLLAIGYAATWYTSAGDGPMWSMVENESAVCRKKFWWMVAFLQNMVDPGKICLVQTWIMAVDMQLYIPVVILTLLLKNHRQWAPTVLAALFAAVLALTVHMSFVNGYKPAYTYMTPEVYRTFFGYTESFVHFFMTPFNCMMAAVAGVWVAFYHVRLQEEGIKLSEKLSVFSYVCHVSLYAWSYCYYYIKDISDPYAVAAMMGVERIVYCFLIGAYIVLMLNVNSKLISLLRWKSFRIISRMSLAIAMVHWCVNGIIIGNRYTLLDSSLSIILLDTIGIYVISCILAVPFTLMVDIPVTRTLKSVMGI